MEAHEYEQMAKVEAEHFWFVGTRDVIISALARAVPEAQRQTATVLDVGCGTGYTLGRLAQAGYAHRRVGIDLNARALELAKKKDPEAELVCANVLDLPFEDDTFDVVLALDMLEHVEDDHTAARQLARVLRPGGTLLLTVPAVPALWSAHDEALHHHRRYVRATLLEVLRGADVEIDLLGYYNSLLFPAVAAARLLGRVRRALARGPSASTSDASLPPAPLNGVLRSVLSFERHLIGRVPLPIGVSLMAVCRGKR